MDVVVVGQQALQYAAELCSSMYVEVFVINKYNSKHKKDIV